MKALVGANFIADTTSTTFVNLGQTRVIFTQATAGCVIVRFSAEAGNTGAGVMLVRAILDGVDVALPSQVSFAFNDNFGTARSYEFIFPNVAPGSHSVRMQFHSGDGPTVFVNNRTTTVLYK